MKVQVGFSDFVQLCRIKDIKDWVPWLRVEIDGVYKVLPEGDLLPEEIVAFTEGHPTKDLTQPALNFPCSLDQLAEFLEAEGCYGCIDAFDLAAFVENGTVERKKSEPATKSRNSYLRTIDALCRALTGSNLSQAKAVEDVLAALSKTGVPAPLDKRTLYNYLKEARELRDS